MAVVELVRIYICVSTAIVTNNLVYWCTGDPSRRRGRRSGGMLRKARTPNLGFGEIFYWSTPHVWPFLRHKAYISINLHINQSIHPSIDLHIYQSFYLSIHPSTHPSIDPPIYLASYLSLIIHHSIHPSIYPSIQSIHPSIYVSINLSISLSTFYLSIYLIVTHDSSLYPSIFLFI